MAVPKFSDNPLRIVMESQKMDCFFMDKTFWSINSLNDMAIFKAQLANNQSIVSSYS